MKISMYALVNANHNSRITSENFMFYILTLDITDFSEKRNILVSHNASVLLYVCFWHYQIHRNVSVIFNNLCSYVLYSRIQLCISILLKKKKNNCSLQMVRNKSLWKEKMPSITQCIMSSLYTTHFYLIPEISLCFPPIYYCTSLLRERWHF